MRIGTGFDVHAFEPGDHLMLGGVRIPFTQQFRAHSDGDVLLHAIVKRWVHRRAREGADVPYYKWKPLPSTWQ